MHRKQLTIDNWNTDLSGELQLFAVARWPRFSGFDRRAFHLANRDHLSRVRFRQLAPADEPTALSDPGQIFAHLGLIFRHCGLTDESQAFQFSAVTPVVVLDFPIARPAALVTLTVSATPAVKVAAATA
jgi:hypothetical protein